MTTLIAIVTFAAVWAWAVAHQLAIFYFFAVAVDQLPKPSGNNGFYAWFFGVMHLAAANWNRAKMGIMIKAETTKAETDAAQKP